MLRYLIAFCTIVSAFMFPWWTALLFSLYGAFRFPWFLEALVAGLIIDSVYGTHTVLGVPGIATVTALCIVGAMMFFRRYVRYENL
ncbi:MAG: hypothetical protein AMXMBFR44_3170 [Candidatus Campbellbacteria bacterium]